MGARYAWARVSAGLAVVAVLFGWAAGQYPYMLEHSVRISDAAGAHATLVATLVVLGGGSALLVPALTWLFVLMQRGMLAGEH
jgi:cytochrome d ubiquinol oxidase subunit II